LRKYRKIALLGTEEAAEYGKGLSFKILVFMAIAVN